MCKFIPIEPERDEHFDSMHYQLTIGQQCGYPPCCVASFIAMVQTSGNPSAQQTLVSNGSGFIPCEFHTTAIIVKAVTLEDLIHGRDPEIEAFPNMPV